MKSDLIVCFNNPACICLHLFKSRLCILPVNDMESVEPSSDYSQGYNETMYAVPPKHPCASRFIVGDAVRPA